MMDYAKEIENALKFDVLKQDEIYDYRGTPFEEVISMYYKFCRENLNIHSKVLPINPNVIIFNNCFSSNATAKLKKNGVFSISINLGLLKKCNDNFLENPKLDNYIENKFSNLTHNLDNKISGLAFQIAANFTYYHELGHLFQFTKRNENSLFIEQVQGSSVYELHKHFLEINADSFACIALANHIVQYIEDSFQSSLNKEIAENIVTILGACLLNHIANFYPEITVIYLREHSHPHPFLRIFNAILNLSNFINNSEFLQEKSIQLNRTELFGKIIDFYEELEENEIFDTSFSQAIKEGAKMQTPIIDYLGQLIQFNLDDYNNALELWNKHIID